MSTNRPVGLGIVGYGYWGPNLVRNFSNCEGGRVVAVSDRDAAKLDACRQNYPNISTATDYRDLLEDPDVDAVAIATPVHTHFEIALAALRAGKHVLVEKPMAQTSEQVRRLIEEADKRNLVLMVDHTFLYTAAIRKIRELLDRRELGDVFYYDSTRSSLGLFQSDVNVIWDLAVHDVSIILYLLDEMPLSVSATGSCHFNGTPESMAHMTLFFASSCVAHVSVNWLSPIKIRQTFVGGSKKMIVYDDLQPTEKIKVYDKGVTVNDDPETSMELRIGYRAGDMWAPHLETKEALKIEADHFVSCIRNNTRPISDGRSGLRVVEILEAAGRSIAQQGRPIQLQMLAPVWERVG
ncbi:MAG TPA: Gfo/Idh/MocA family oxidoreductase [Xanthobacteraceae bacterium]|nr:Gfo/Idh/MocA family oxidoreductase [Xanthobacteraceae bacterium]